MKSIEAKLADHTTKEKIQNNIKSVHAEKQKKSQRENQL